MTMLLIAKIIHISTAIILIGCVFFRTFTIPKIKSQVDKEFYKKLDQLLAPASRSFGVYNVFILMLSGLYLFYSYFDKTNTLLHIKATLGILIVIVFYLAPFFVHKLVKKYPNFKHYFHLFLIILMGFMVIISQIMFNV